MNNIADFSPFTLNDDQKIAAGLIQNFIQDTEDQVFILKGHAGTGKTTLMKAVVRYLKDQKREPILLASTGRASKILSEKTEIESSTVHKHIYTMQMDERSENESNPKLVFVLRMNAAPTNAVYIVDESSMLSNHQISGGFLNFGTGRLLTDLFRFIGKRKIIFVGDAAQLPPVNCAESPAMWRQSIQANHQVFAQEFTLEQVMRFNENSGINSNANALRKIIYGQTSSANFKLRASQYPEIATYPLDSLMSEHFGYQFKRNGPENQIFLVYSNRMANEINKLIRRELGLNHTHIANGEWFMVSQNNYMYEVSNGDHLELLDFDKQVEHKAGLKFRKVMLKKHDQAGGKVVSALLIDDLLYQDAPNLSVEQEQLLFKDFAIRMSKENIKPKQNKETYLMRMLSDPYLNALRLKYGYAITCHKAQGGEWPEVFVVLENALFHPNNAAWMHRWIYTAITRASLKLHLRENLLIR